MSDTSTQEGASHRQGGRGRRRRGGKGFRGNPNRPAGQGGNYTIRPDRRPKQSGFQKFLSVITFGLLGQPKPRVRPERPDRPDRPERTPEERAERQARRQERQEQRGPRPPRDLQPPGEVTTDRLYVGNLSYDATEGDLFELFNGVGQVRNAEVVVNSRTERSKGFAFVTMASIEQAKRAVDELHGKEFMGRPLQVNGAKPPQGDRGERREATEQQPSAA